jgi:hypothetical protein
MARIVREMSLLSDDGRCSSSRSVVSGRRVVARRGVRSRKVKGSGSRVGEDEFVEDSENGRVVVRCWSCYDCRLDEAKGLAETDNSGVWWGLQVGKGSNFDLWSIKGLLSFEASSQLRALAEWVKIESLRAALMTSQRQMTRLAHINAEEIRGVDDNKGQLGICGSKVERLWSTNSGGRQML